MRVEFELDKEQLIFIMRACEALPGSGKPDEEFVNRAWDILGKHMGFDGRTCEPVPGKDEEFFTAETVE